MGVDEVRRGGARKGCLIAAAIGLGLIVLALLGAGLYDWTWERRFEAKLQEYRDAGAPATWEEVLAARPRIPDSENAALVLLDAFGHMGEPRRADDWLLDQVMLDGRQLGCRNSTAMLDLARTRLEALDEPLRLTHEAAQLEAGVYAMDPRERPAETFFDYLSHTRRMARLLSIKAACCAQSGDVAAAAEALLDGRVLPASIEGAVSLMQAQVRAGTATIWAAGIEDTLGVCALPVEDVSALRRAIAAEEARLSTVDAFIGERAAYRDTVDWVSSTDALMGEWNDEAKALRPRLLLPGWAARNALPGLDAMTEALRITAMPMPKRLGEAKALGERVLRTVGATPGTFYLSSSLMPCVVRITESELRGHACLRAAAAALAAEEWRLEHGDWPESLDALVPGMLDAVPQDPFTGEPLRYRQRDDGVAVYSVGPDGRDDGGVTVEEAREAAGEAGDECSDIPFRLLDAELRGAQTLTFRDEVMGVGYLSRQDLEEAGFPQERLVDLGLTEEDIGQLR